MATIAMVLRHVDVTIRGDRHDQAMRALQRAADMAHGLGTLPDLRPDVLENYPMLYVAQAIDEAIELLRPQGVSHAPDQTTMPRTPA